MDENEARVFTGGEYTITLSKHISNVWEYEIAKGTQVILTGGDYDDPDMLIADLSELHEALRAVFG